MSYFGNKLSELLNIKKINQSEFSRLIGISQAHISKLINGTQVWISPDDLEKICTGISTDTREQAELIRAHLQDECTGPGSDLIEIRINGKLATASETAPRWRPDAPTRFVEQLELLSQNADDKDLRTIVEGLANLFEGDRSKPTTAPTTPVSYRRRPPAPRLRPQDG